MSRARSNWKVVRVVLVSFLLTSSSYCGGGDDGCIDCEIAGDLSNCPELSKTCAYGDIVVQQCVGTGAGDPSDPSGPGCCTTDVAEISCNLLVAYDWSGQYDVVDGLVILQGIGAGSCIDVTIDPTGNGWVHDGMTESERHPVIARKMAELSAEALTF